MPRILVNYADRGFYRAQQYNAYTALQYGGLTHYASYRRSDLDPVFVRQHDKLLNVTRGAGLWLWKPYLILHTLRRAQPGDFIVYADSGSVFSDRIDPLLEVCADATPGILGCDLGVLMERQWSKRDAFVLMGCDSADFHNTPQLMASFLIFLRNDASLQFVEQWLQYALDPRLLTDAPSVCGEPELVGFRAHHHDQSIFSLLYKKWGLRSYQQISGQGVDEIFQLTRCDPPFLADLTPYLSQRWLGVEPSETQPPGRDSFGWYDPHLILLRAQALLSSDRFDEAITALDGLLVWLQQQPQTAQSKLAEPQKLYGSIHATQAIGYFRLQQYAEAERCYALAEQYLPDHLEYKVKRQLCHNLKQQQRNAANKQSESTPVVRPQPQITSTPRISTAKHSPLILLYNGFPGEIPECIDCPSPYRVTQNRRKAVEADAVVYHIPTLRKPTEVVKRPGQKAVAISMESEILYPLLADKAFMAQFDISMTYRQEATIWCAYFGPSQLEELHQPVQPKTAASPICCFISNSGITAYDRTGYLEELMRHIALDSYGSALRNRTLQKDRGRETKLAVSASYKFTLAFENSICKDYVTEKFFDPLVAGSVPVYLGAPNIDEFAPGEHCYIDAADFAEPKELARYLNKLNADNNAYQHYLDWKNRDYRPSFIVKAEQQRLDGLCRLCLLLRAEHD